MRRKYQRMARNQSQAASAPQANMMAILTELKTPLHQTIQAVQRMANAIELSFRGVSGFMAQFQWQMLRPLCRRDWFPAVSCVTKELAFR